jgi:hypothetical protein
LFEYTNRDLIMLLNSLIERIDLSDKHGCPNRYHYYLLKILVK